MSHFSLFSFVKTSAALNDDNPQTVYFFTADAPSDSTATITHAEYRSRINIYCRDDLRSSGTWLEPTSIYSI